MYTKDLENKLNKVKCTGEWKAKTRQMFGGKRTNTRNYTAMKFETLREVDKLQSESHFIRLEEVEKAQEVFNTFWFSRRWITNTASLFQSCLGETAWFPNTNKA